MENQISRENICIRFTMVTYTAVWHCQRERLCSLRKNNVPRKLSHLGHVHTCLTHKFAANKRARVIKICGSLFFLFETGRSTTQEEFGMMPATRSEIIVSEPQKGLVEICSSVCSSFNSWLRVSTCGQERRISGNSGDPFWFIANDESRPNHPIKLVSTQIKVLWSSRLSWRFTVGMFQQKGITKIGTSKIWWPLIPDPRSPCLELPCHTPPNSAEELQCQSMFFAWYISWPWKHESIFLGWARDRTRFRNESEQYRWLRINR